MFASSIENSEPRLPIDRFKWRLGSKNFLIDFIGVKNPSLILNWIELVRRRISKTWNDDRVQLFGMSGIKKRKKTSSNHHERHQEMERKLSPRTRLQSPNGRRNSTSWSTRCAYPMSARGCREDGPDRLANEDLAGALSETFSCELFRMSNASFPRNAARRVRNWIFGVPRAT